MKESYEIVPRKAFFVYLDGDIVVKPMALLRVKKHNNLPSLVWAACPLCNFCNDLRFIADWPLFACSDCPVDRRQKEHKEYAFIVDRLLDRYGDYASRLKAVNGGVIKEGFSFKVPENLIRDLKSKLTKFTATHPLFVMRVAGAIKPLLNILSIEEAVKSVFSARAENKRSRVRLYVKIGEKYAEIIF